MSGESNELYVSNLSPGNHHRFCVMGFKVKLILTIALLQTWKDETWTLEKIVEFWIFIRFSLTGDDSTVFSESATLIPLNSRRHTIVWFEHLSGKKTYKYMVTSQYSILTESVLNNKYKLENKSNNLV